MRFGLKKVLTELFALALVAGILLVVWSMQVMKLSKIDGERVFYLNSASSQGLRTTQLSIRDYPKVKGESVTFSLGEESGEEAALRVINMYGAEILFTEEASGTVSYYCYTDKWNNALAVNGYQVNLHVAVSASQCAVGTPIIFDGF